MSSQDDRPKSLKQFVFPTVTVITAFVILLGLRWLVLSQRDPISLLEPSVARGTKTTPEPTEPWPTIPATFTPSAPPALMPTRTAVPTSTPTRPPTATPIVPPSISQIRQILEVNFIQYKGTTIIERDIKKWWGRDWVVLIAVGRIRVGIDLAQGAPPDMQINGSSIKLVLPHAKVTSVELLPEECKVYDSKRNWLLSEYPGLEVEASGAAKAALEEAGQRETAILDAVETIARETLSDLFHRLGYTEVEIRFDGESH